MADSEGGFDITSVAASLSDDWAHSLDPGETVLWQGRPCSRLRWEFESPFEALNFPFWTGVLVLWAVMEEWNPLFVAIMALLFGGLSLWTLVGQPCRAAFVRAHTVYTLTDRLALIATEVFGKREIRCYPIGTDTRLKLVHGAPGALLFLQATFVDEEGFDRPKRLGVETIEYCHKVIALMRAAQKGPPSSAITTRRLAIRLENRPSGCRL